MIFAKHLIRLQQNFKFKLLNRLQMELMDRNNYWKKTHEDLIRNKTHMVLYKCREQNTTFLLNGGQQRIFGVWQQCIINNVSMCQCVIRSSR